MKWLVLGILIALFSFFKKFIEIIVVILLIFSYKRLLVDKSNGGIQPNGNKSAFHRSETNSKLVGKNRDSPPSTSANTIEQHTI